MVCFFRTCHKLIHILTGIKAVLAACLPQISVHIIYIYKRSLKKKRIHIQKILYLDIEGYYVLYRHVPAIPVRCSNKKMYGPF